MTDLRESNEGSVHAGRRQAVPSQFHVAHIVLNLEVGGMERVVVDLVREGLALAQRLSVVTVSSRGELASVVEAMGVPVICVNKPPGLKMGAVKDLAAVFRKLRPDVVHTHQIGALFYAGRAARLAKVPLVVHTEHGKHFARLRTRWMGRFAACYAARFFCVSEDLASHVRLNRVAPPRKVVVVVNGIDTDRFSVKGKEGALSASLGIPAGVPLIGTIGRLNEVKRQDVLLRAFAILLQSVPTAHLLIVGDGPLMNDLRGLAIELSISSVVHFVGYQASPELYLQMMDVFALSSRSEGMPLVLLEAGAAGLPVVATRVGGVPEVIVEGETGLMVPPENETALATALCNLLHDIPMARQMGEAARRRVVAEFSLRRMAAEYQRHYRELLQKR